MALTQSEIEALPEQERWLYRAPEAMASLDRGIADAAAGRVKSLGSFTAFVDDELGEV